MANKSKPADGQGGVDSLPFFSPTGRPSPLSAKDLNRLVRAILPLLNMRGTNGVEVTKGDGNTLVGLSKELISKLSGDGAQSTTATPAASASWNYRGGYDPATTYYMFDVVKVGYGFASGMYLSTIDVNNNAPDSGIGWVQISNIGGAWV